MSNYVGESRRYSNRVHESNNEKGKFRNQRNVPNWNEQTRPLGLIKKYPNYEPFHPPPQENFEYPPHMHPPQKRASSDENFDKRGEKYERSSRDRFRTSDPHKEYRDRTYSRDRHHRHSNRSCDRRSRSTERHNRSSDRRSRENESYRRDIRSHSRERRSRSSPRDRMRSRSTDRRRHDSPFSNNSDKERDIRNKRSESRENVSEDDSLDSKPSTDYWQKTETAEDSEVDLEIELHPLTHHLHERKRLFIEALRSLKQKRLTALIPPLLKDMSLKELERSCLEILEELGAETVLRILEGKLAGMFDKAEERGGKVAEQVPTMAEDAKKKKKKISDAADDERMENETERTKKSKKVANEGGKSRSMKKKKLKEPTSLDESKVKKKKQKKKHTKEKSKGKSRKKHKGQKDEDQAGTGGHKSLMELLELEFRAKAIKALLRTQGVLGMDVDAALAPDEPCHTSSLNTSHDLNRNHDGKSKKSREVSVPGSNLKTSTLPTRVLADKEKEALPPNNEGEAAAVNVSSPDSLDSISSESSDSDADESAKEQDLVEFNCNDNEFKRNDVIDMVDEALTAQFDETLVNSTPNEDAILEAPKILLGLSGCAASEIDGDKLRSKLLRNYRKRARKAKKVAEEKETEDVLELHAEDSASNSDPELSDDEVSLKDGEREEHSNSESEPKLESVEKQELQEDKKFPQSLTSKEIPEDLVEQMEEDTIEEIREEAEEGEIMSDAVSNHSDDHSDLPEKHEVVDRERSKSRSARTSRSWRNERHHSGSDDLNSNPGNPSTEHGWEPESLVRPQSPVEYISNFDTEPISESSSPERLDASKPKISSPKAVFSCAERPNSPTENSSSTKDSELGISNEISSKAAADEQEVDNRGNEDSGRTLPPSNELEEDPKPITWYERWFQSKNMQKVVKTNKIQKKLRNKLKSTNPKKKVPPNLDVNAEESEPIIGSIEEYEKLFGKKMPESEKNEPSGKVLKMPENGENSEQQVQSDVEDNEDDDLWGDIIGDDDPQ